MINQKHQWNKIIKFSIIPLVVATLTHSMIKAKSVVMTCLNQ